MPRPPKNQDTMFDNQADPRTAAMEAELERLRERNEQLNQREYEMPEQQYDDAPLSFRDTPELHLLVGIFLVVGKTFLWLFVERLGTRAPNEAIGSNILFGAGGVFVLCEWVRWEWQINQSLFVAKAVFVVVGIIVSADMFTGGGIWDGEFQHSGADAMGSGFLIVILALILAASSISEYTLSKTAKFLKHPIRTMKGWLW